MNKIRITHFSDILCIWAYIGQIRIDELHDNFTEQVEVNFCLFSVFGATKEKMQTAWGNKGGVKSYNQHVLEVSEQFQHVSVHKDIWLKDAPQSSLPSHLYLSAVKLLEQKEEITKGSYTLLAKRIRSAFFAELQDVSNTRVLSKLVEESNLALDKILSVINSGQAYATMSSDMQQAQSLLIRSSPTLLFNEDRQRLAGNVGYRIIEANIRELLDQPEMQQSWC